MQATEQHYNYQSKGRYFSHGNPKTAKHLIVALHGYGQLAYYFMRKFTHLNPADYFVVCPEGAHRFYLKGTGGRVGASWMSKEDRFTDIENYLMALQSLWQNTIENETFETKTLLGFSQGGATASRWLAYGGVKFDRFVLWAAVFPPDMEEKYTDQFLDSANFYVIGTADEYATVAKAKTRVDELNNSGFNFKFITFEGNHTINSDTLNLILNENSTH